MEIPVYLFLGFLESGKTTFIQDTLEEDYFATGEKTLILACEDGVEEYEEELLKETNCVLVMLENQEDLTVDFLKKCQKEHQPERVLFEYNGMWPMNDLMEMLDETDWMIYQTITTVDAATFDLYMNNMRSLAMEMYKYSDMVVFNRCDQDTKKGVYRRSIKAVNRRVQVAFEMDEDDEMEEDDEELPFDLEADIIEIEDEDYGIWYIDAMDQPKKYAGKVIKMKTIVCKPDDFPKGTMIPGRFAMTCCADDIQFIGYICQMDHVKSATMKRVENRDWVMLTARITCEYHEEYGQEGPVLHAIAIEKSEKPEDDLIYF